MLGSKRPANGICPDRPPVKLIKDDALSVYESTFQKMHGRVEPPPRMAGGSAEQDLQACLCKPDHSVVEREKTTATIVSQVAASSSLASSSLQTPCIPIFQRSSCFHCRRVTCAKCWRQCAQCEEEFCSVCSILDFNERYDRAFCLDCYSSIQMTSS